MICLLRSAVKLAIWIELRSPSRPSNLRKDFPLTGHIEVRYSEDKKKVVYEPVKLEQNYRNFDYESPWEGTKYIKEQTKK